MAVEQEFANSLIEHLIYRASDLLRSSEQLEGLTYPSEGPLKLAKFVSGATKRIVEELAPLASLSYEQVEPVALRRGSLLAILHGLLEHVGHAQTHGVPAAIVQPLEALIRQQVSDVGVIIRWTWDFNYHFDEIAGSLRELSTFVPYLSELLEEFPQHLVVLQFPVAAKDDMLLHAAFGHEIGHFVGRVKRIDEKIAIHLEGGLLSGIDPEYHAGILTSIQSWYKELISDLVGIRLFGPACFLAFSQVAFHALNMAGLRHPAPIDRLHLMLSLLEELGYLDHQAESGATALGVLPDTYKLFFVRYKKFLDKIAKPSDDPITAVIRKSVFSLNDDLKKNVAEEMKEGTYDAAEFRRVVEKLSERLAVLVPPDEIREDAGTIAPDLVAILNSGWLVYTTRLDELCKLLHAENIDERSRVRQKINDLLAKAVEDTVIKNLWPKAVRKAKEDAR